MGGPMNDLIERIEAASGPDRGLDEKIGMAVGLKNTIRVGHECLGTDRIVPVRCPYYTESIDAALTLVPEGWWLAGLHFCHPDFRSEQDKEWCAELAGPVTWSVIDREVGEEPIFENVSASAATPALALSASAMKADAYLKETNNAD